MSGLDCGLSLGAQADAAPPERPARTGPLHEVEISEENDCHNFHELPKRLSTRNKWPSRQSSSSAPSGTISAWRGADFSTRTKAHDMRQQFSLGAILFMTSLIVQMFSINFALHSNSWPRQELARSDRTRQANLLTWSSSANSDSSRSELIPSARYVYTYSNQARKRVRAPATSTRNGDRIRHLHDQLNQLRRELDQELRRDSQGAEVADSSEVNTTGEGATRSPPAPPLAVSQIELGSPCLSSNFCQKSIRNSQCNLERFTCECVNEHVKLNSTTCLAPALLGFECQLDDQCRRRVADSVCRAGKCSCQDENLLAYKRNKCLRASKLNDYCLLDGQCQLNDKHSFCRWKIQNVYGTCKCPPNYKLTTDQSNELRCAPRLGDSCLSDLECRLATENSICGHLEAFSAKRKWVSSLASNRSCTCGTGFRWSENMLECLPVPNEANSTLADSLSLQQMSVGDAKKQEDSHRYELLDVPQMGTTSNDSQTQANGRNKSPAGQGELEIVKLVVPMSDTSTRQKTTTTTSTERPTLNEGQTQLDTNTTFRMVSLGKACRWRQECQARDPNSDCIDGVCECLAPSSRCRASARGCHPNTFQCRSGQCISWYFVCDQFRNCDDGSDEDDCRPGHCPREAFQCRADGQCLTRGRVCDGQRDCLDGSDEFGCGSGGGGGGGGVNQTKYGNNNNSSSGCPAEAFACANGQCLPGYVFCNAVEDCADGSDEDELICERASASTVAANHYRTPTAAASGQPGATLGQTQARPPARRNETVEAESPLVKTDRASIERLMAALGLSNAAKWRQKSPAAGSQTSRRSRLMTNRRPLEERRGPTAQAMARRQHLVKNQRHGHGTETSSLECPASGFTCRNGKCRSSAILCSGIDGCGDNSDEDHCEVCQCEPPPPSRSTNSRRHNLQLT